jgi:hypothetical protein
MSSAAWMALCDPVIVIFLPKSTELKPPSLQNTILALN